MKVLLTLTVAVLLFGTTNAQVTSDYDKTIDFSKYKTFSFEGWQKNSDKAINDLDKTRLRNAFTREFTDRELNIVEDNADATVTLYLVLDKKTSTTAYTDYNGGMGYGAGVGVVSAGWGWGMGSSTTTYQENDYVQGTLVMDIYDATTKKLIWQGVSQSIVQSNAGKRAKTIPKKIGKLMKQYPVQAK